MNQEHSFALAEIGHRDSLLQAYRGLNTTTLSVITGFNALLLSMQAQAIIASSKYVAAILVCVLFGVAAVAQFAFCGIMRAREADLTYWNRVLQSCPLYAKFKEDQLSRRKSPFGSTRNAVTSIFYLLWFVLVVELGMALWGSAVGPHVPAVDNSGASTGTYAQQVAAYNERAAETVREQRESSEHLEQGGRLLQRQEDYQGRLEKLIARWQENLDREAALIAKQEGSRK